MGYKYRTGDRTFGGSMEPRLNPGCSYPELNKKLPPTMPNPLVRATSRDNSLPDPYPARKKLTGLRNGGDY